MNNKITIVIPLRNDNYYNNFSQIVNYTVDYSLKKIFQLNLQNTFKIMLIDWMSEKPISHILKINKIFQKNISSYYVQNYKDSNNNLEDISKRMNVSEVHNFGLDITKTEYCFLAHADQIYSKTFFLNINSFINYKYLNKSKTENAILYIPRKFLDDKFFENYPNEETTDGYFENLNFISQKWKNYNYYVGGGLSGYLGKTSTLKKFNGVKEDLLINKKQIISADLEFFQRYSQMCKFYDSSNFGIFSYRFHYQFSPTRNSLLLDRIPPIEVDNIKKKRIKKKYNFFETKFIQKPYKIPNFKFYFKIPIKLSLYNFLKEIRILAKLKIDFFQTNESIHDFFLKKKLIYLIKNTRTLNYTEFGFNKNSNIALIGSLFKGIDILGADINFLKENKKISNRFYKLLSFFNKNKFNYRYGMTKLISYHNISESKKIFYYLPNEKFSSIILLSEGKIHFDEFKRNYLKFNKNIWMIIVKKKNFKNKINKFKLILTSNKYSYYTHNEVINDNLKKYILDLNKNYLLKILEYLIFKFFNKIF